MIKNFVFCDEDGNCKIDYPFSLPEGNEQYKISKERARTIIIGNIFSFCLLGLVVVLLFFSQKIRLLYFAIQVLSILCLLLFQEKDVILFSTILICLFFWWLTKYTGDKNKNFSGVSFFCLVLLLFELVFYEKTILLFIILALTGFPEEIVIFSRIGHRDSSVRDYIKKTWKIYKIIKANDVLKRAFKNEFKELDSIFGLENIDFNKEVKLSQYDMARNAMLEHSCNLLTHRHSSEKTLVDLHKYMLDKDFKTLVKTCKRDIIKMFVVVKKLSAYLSIFLRKKGNNKK